MKTNPMPKLESPFVRQKIGEKFVCVPEIAEGYDWVFVDSATMAIEKLCGVNTSIYIENGVITHIWSRERRVPFFNLGYWPIIEALENAYVAGYMEFLPDGQHFGECIGPDLEKNRHKIEKPAWIPFETYARKHLQYTDWRECIELKESEPTKDPYCKNYKTFELDVQKTFDAVSEWMKNLQPIYAKRVNSPSTFIEGVVFVHPDGRMAKLRRDMFDWYVGFQHKEKEEK